MGGRALFRRDHHQRIDLILGALDAELLHSHKCYFGGGTAIALIRGEYRESRDIDFLVSDGDGYRGLRDLVRREGPGSLFRDQQPFGLPQTFLSDQYGIRGWVYVLGTRIKLEIIQEGRIQLEEPEAIHDIVPVAMLTPTDLIAEKLLANSDRFLDTATFSRDLIDLAFLEVQDIRKTAGFAKATLAYGPALGRDLDTAIDTFLSDFAWVDRCAKALDLSAPRALIITLVERLRAA